MRSSLFFVSSVRVFVALCVFVSVFCVLPHTAHADLPVRSAIMINLHTGKTLYQKNANLKIPPASLTKIMTSYLVHEAIQKNKLRFSSRTRISKSTARVGGSTMNLRAGERPTVSQLLHGMIIASGNDAATALAIRTSGSTSKFVRAMNAKARQLGMKSTRFKNPSGLPAAGQVTTARDMLRLCVSYLSKYPKAMRIHSQSSFLYKGKTIGTTNPFLGSRGVDGLKTGFTINSGYHIILTSGQQRERLLIIVMGGRSKVRRERAAAALLDAGRKYPHNAQMVRKLIDGSKKQLQTREKKSTKRKRVTRKK